MDNIIVSYILRVAIVIAMFCVLFSLFFRDEKFHRLNRVTLLFTTIVSYILPMIALRLWITVPLKGSFFQQVFGENASMKVGSFFATDGLIDWGVLGRNITPIYISGAVLCVIIFSISIVSVLMKFKRSKPVEVIKLKGKTIKIYTVSNGMSFSWMNNVAIDRCDYLEGGRKLKYITDHEIGHVLGRHSYDIILMNILVALQWFNPFVYLMRSFLKDVHEYQADEYALEASGGGDSTEIADSETPASSGQIPYSKEYKYLLLSKVATTNLYFKISGLSSGSVVDRIKMMSKVESPSIRRLRVLYVPLAMALVLIFFGVVHVIFR